jgi:Ca-activated chloride channel family protein
MLRFENSTYLFLLILVPVFTGLYFLVQYQRKRRLRKLGDPALIGTLMPDYSQFRRNLKALLLVSAVLCLVIAIAGPQSGSKLTEVKREGIEIIIALDVSNSMLAEDIKPNRLEKAKQELSRLLDRLENDRLGLIVFAGDAFTQIPITNDYLSAKMFLSGINTSMVSRQGTAIGAAIELAARSFSTQTTAGKAIIIISDGENHEGGVEDACEAAADKGIKIYTIGMGLSQGARIPMRNDEYNRDFRRDNEGNFVITRLNEQMLKDIAAAGNGNYYRANSPNMGLNEMLAQLNDLDKAEMDYREYTEYEEQFPVMIWLALALLALEYMVLDRRNRWLKKIRVFN